MTPREALEKWCGALESGKYQQDTQGYSILRTPAGCFCALGVACEDLAPYLKRKWGVKQGSGYPSFYGSSTCLRGGVAQLLGIGPRGNLRKAVEGWKQIADLNDRARYTFPQIAQVIREQFLSEAA